MLLTLCNILNRFLIPEAYLIIRDKASRVTEFPMPVVGINAAHFSALLPAFKYRTDALVSVFSLMLTGSIKAGLSQVQIVLLP